MARQPSRKVTKLRLPGLIDVHVHMREPGATHKEDWESGTSAALAGGFTAVLAMPNTDPPVLDSTTLGSVLEIARSKARCDFAQFIGAGPENAASAAGLAAKTAGLKMYLDLTFGDLRLDDMTLWEAHFLQFPKAHPIVVHAEGRTLAAAILFSHLHRRPVHIAHVSLREEILLIRKAKGAGIPITCEVAPHHLFLTEDAARGGAPAGVFDVRPALARQRDVDALWQNLDAIDCFATDHAPHTLAEKNGSQPPPGFPGLETALPLLLTAVRDGRLTLDDLVAKLYTRPREIFHLPEQRETWIEVDDASPYEIHASEQFTRCGWTPFEGWKVAGRVERVVLRGMEAYVDGKLRVQPGFGKHLRD